MELFLSQKKMKNFCKHLLWMFFAIGVLNPLSSYTKGQKHRIDEELDLFLCKEQKKKSKHKRECSKHNIQLQLSDSLGFPVPGTEFWVTLDIIKEDDKVNIQFPLINFQTGPVSPEDPFYPEGGLVPGGYLYTSDGFLPENVRPNDLVYRSIVAASNNGASQPFSFVSPPEPPYANIPAGYILSVTNAGAIVVQCAGTFGNIIPPGPQILMPANITYSVKPKIQLCENTIIQSGFTNTTQFTGLPANVQLRDSHINDAFDNVFAWSWTSNSNIHDKTNGTTDVFVAIGTVASDGTLKVGTPVQLTTFAPGDLAADTSVAINRNDKNNIVVSYGFISSSTSTLTIYRAVSCDGGLTWPVNGPITNAPSFNNGGDTPGVQSDKFGNIWYCYGQPFATDNPTFLVSSDGGINFKTIFITPLPPFFNPNDFGYDFPQYCFGEDGQGNYGLWFVTDYINSLGNLFKFVGFIPIKGCDQFGIGSITPVLTSLTNTNGVSNIAASLDGRVWIQGVPNAASSYIQPQGVTFKSPGPLDQNYAGLWNNIIFNNGSTLYLATSVESQPIRGYFNSVRTIIYDDSRQALYAITAAQYPDYSQNMRLYFIISRDNGQTWSSPIDIATTDFANRGFQSMALDTMTGDLIFGWYDGRNDPTFKSIQYFGAILPAKELDKLVEAIPLSNPLYSIPSAAGVPTQLAARIEMSEVQQAAIKKHFERRFEDRRLKNLK